MSTRKKTIDFEKSLEQIETLVNDLEQGNLSLEESLQAYEKGIKLTRECQKALSEAEQKVELLSRDGENVTAFDVESK